MMGAVFSAPREPVEGLLPEGLRPIRVPVGNAAVAFLSVEYHRIGDGAIDPYNEFAVVLPAVSDSMSSSPSLATLNRGLGGYVWYLPVTTEPAKALGVDIWGFPKTVADIIHEDDGSRRRTTVAIDGERFITFEVARLPSVSARLTSYAYVRKDGEPLCVPSEVDAEMGVWPFSENVSVAFGDHHRAEPLRELDMGGRALARLSVEGEVRFHPGESLDPT